MHKDPLLDVLLHILVVVDAILAKGEFTGVQGAQTPTIQELHWRQKGRSIQRRSQGMLGALAPYPHAPPNFLL